MRRLSLMIFLSLLASLTLMALAVSWAWRWQVTHRAEARESRFTEALAADVIPAAAEGLPRLQQALHALHRRLRVDLQVIDAHGKLLASAGRPFTQKGTLRSGQVPAAPDDAPGRGDGAGRTEGGADGPGRGHRPPLTEPVVHQVALPDERTLLVRSWRPVPPRPPISAPTALALLFVAVGLAAWPVSRRITRRLEA